MAATLQDIAKHAGVSTMTASRVLRGMGRVNPQTREKVVEIAQRLGYRKLSNGQAGSDLHLRVMMGEGKIHIKDRSTNHPVHGNLHYQLAGELQQQLEQSGGKLLMTELQSLEQIVADVQKHKPHGLVLRQPIPTDWLDVLREMLPIVYAVSYDHQSGVDSLYTNEHRSAAMIYKKLTDMGHREIGWFGIVDRHSATHEWGEMFESNCLVDRLCCSIHAVRYAAWANLAYCQVSRFKQPMILVERDWRIQSLQDVVRDAVDQFLQLRPQPTAIVTPADEIGLTMIDILKQRGLKVPDDVSIVSYGGSLNSEDNIPRLASVVLPMSAIGKAIPELIRRRLADPKALPVSMQLETDFIEGSTLGPARS
ncbi:MAG: LacI family DNA-binding transcriptional regulator [Phycisphaeraceae bacterium JB051]